MKILILGGTRFTEGLLAESLQTTVLFTQERAQLFQRHGVLHS